MTRLILSINGGGRKGIMPAIWCAEIERAIGMPIHKAFDLIVGTSTGGLIATSLAAGYSAASVVDSYKADGDRIFQDPRGFFARLFKTKYTHEGLAEVAFDKFGDTRMHQAKTNLCVTAYNLDACRPSFFKSWDGRDAMTTMRDVCLATTSAPTYFPAHEIMGSRYVDGGIFINNPVLSAYADARRLWPLSDLVVVSLGTGISSKKAAPKGIKNGGLLSWALYFPFASMSGVGSVAQYQMRSIAKEGLELVEIDSVLPYPIDMDGADERTEGVLRTIAESQIGLSIEQFQTIAGHAESRSI